MDPSSLKMIEALVLQNIEKPEPQARLMAVHYAKEVFPGDNIPSRYLLLLACGDVKEQVYLEASKALRTIKPVGDGEQNEFPSLLPSFTGMVHYISEKSNQRMKSGNTYVFGNNVLPFNPATYGEILMYLRMCLAHSAGLEPDLESTSVMQEQAPAIAKYIHSEMTTKPGEKDPIGLYIGIIKQLLTVIGGAPAMYCLVEMVAMCKDKLANQFVKQLDWIKKFMSNTKEEMREFAAQLYALVIIEGHTNKGYDTIEELTKGIKSEAQEGQHGFILALGYIIGRTFRKKRSQFGDVAVEEMETEDQIGRKENDTLNAATIKVAGYLDDAQPVLSTAACTALGEIGRSGVLPLPNESSSPKAISKLSIVENLIKKTNSVKEHPKVREKAATTLGLICVGDPAFAYRTKVLEGLLSAAESKQFEVLSGAKEGSASKNPMEHFEFYFTVGESLVCSALGPKSPAGREYWTCTVENYKASMSEASDDVGQLITLLLEKYLPSLNPHIRQAACIWLLTVVKQCGQHNQVQKKLPEMQRAFMQLLSDNNEITQDVASKGLGLVYENCSQEQKDTLVSSLVDTLMVGKKQAQQVTGSTKVFEEGALGKTPDGKDLSTYKELCSIASDLNQPDLIYKFMNLAHHNSMWNSRKGAAFGFSTIAAQAGDQLAPFLHKIVPKLYRYQFDPNPKIRQVMTTIWTSLVPESKKTVDEYLELILDDLMKSLTTNQWRERESSCIALNDLIRGRQLDAVVSKFPVLLETLFRVMDDIKESVRNAAEITTKTLCRICIKMSDPTYGSIAGEVTSLMLHSLLKAGLPCPVKDIQVLSLNTIMKMAKNAGPLLKPHIAVLVTALLESLSSLEPQMLNYLSLQVSSSQAVSEKLDSARVAATKTSPMMETINICIQFIDPTVLSDLVPRLAELIRSGVGLGTKAGCAQVVVSLTQHCTHDMTPFAGKLLNSLMSGLNDRNAAVRKSYASAIGHLFRVAKTTSIDKIITKLRTWYLEKGDESVQHACGVTLAAINERSPDVLKAHGSSALPLAFLAMHEKKETSNSDSDSEKSVWEDVWLDATPGTEGGIRLYLPELVSITKEALGSQSWPMKAQAASAMKTMATKLGSQLGPPHLGLLLNALLEGLSGRTWTGKESLLKAISSVCISCKESLSESLEGQPPMSQVLDSLMKECKKENKLYKMEALTSTAAIVEAHEIDRFQDFADMLYPILRKEKLENEDQDMDKNVILDLQICAIDCLGRAWPKQSTTQLGHQETLVRLLSTFLTASTWKTDVSVLKSLQKVLMRLELFQNKTLLESNKAVLETILMLIINPLCQALANVKYGSVRSEALEVSHFIINRLKELENLPILTEKQVEKLKQALTDMVAGSQPELQDKSSNLVKVLKEL